MRIDDSFRLTSKSNYQQNKLLYTLFIVADKNIRAKKAPGSKLPGAE